MKKYYIRAGALPYELLTPQKCLQENIYGKNAGNLIYQNSVIKTLTLNKYTCFKPNRFKTNPKDASLISKEYDAFILPLAPAFRIDFMKELRELTTLIKELTIPTIVIGVGIVGSYEPDFSQGFPFDEDVRAFVNAVLNSGSILGLRGEITGEYLKRLGYIEEKHYTVIGCPSLYTNGMNLNIRQPKISNTSKISLHSNYYTNELWGTFLSNIMKNYPNYQIIGQEIVDLRLLYTGYPIQSDEFYPCKSIYDEPYQQNKYHVFTNVNAWTNYLKTMDFNIGTRFHGTVAGLLAGTPSAVLSNDARKRELVDYHKIPHFTQKDLQEVTNLPDLLDKINFTSIKKVHERNFNHFLDFMKANNLPTIYDSPHEDGIFEQRVKEASSPQYINSIIEDKSQVSEQIQLTYQYLDKQLENYKRDIFTYKNWIKAKNTGMTIPKFLKKKKFTHLCVFAPGEFAERIYEEFQAENCLNQLVMLGNAKDTAFFHECAVHQVYDYNYLPTDLIVVTKFEYLNEISVGLANSNNIIPICELIQLLLEDTDKEM